MNLQIEKSEKHFYLYCALFYNNNRTIDSNDVVSEVSTKVIEVLSAINFRKIDMPMHSYHYLMGLYNPDGYIDNGNTMKQPQEITDYINELSNISQLQDLFKQQEPELDQKLNRYEEKFEYITKHFNTYFDFEPKDKTFILTRNWDASGKCISTKEGAHILVGWRIKGLNAKQILHEITHSFISTCTLPVYSDIENILNTVPDYVKQSYANPKILTEESFIRALVVYLDHLEGDTFEFSLNEDDLSMYLPSKFLEKMQKDNITVISQEYINNFRV